MANKNILLIEPGYRNKYPPLGLMKIASYHGPYGKNDRVKFIKGEVDKSVLGQVWDRIYVTTLFTFEWKAIERSIDFALKAAGGHSDRVFVGGIAASLMPEEFLAVERWHGIRFIQGLLSDSPSAALKLDEMSGELYADDIEGTAIEDLVPDYSILDNIQDQYVYPVTDAYFAYASRGCIRKCHFCGVPKLEGQQREGSSLTQIVREVDARYGQKKDLTLMDNNITAAPNFKNIIAEIRDLGFTPDAKLKRPGRPSVLRRVDFNQGVDARILAKDKGFLRELSTVCIKPLRIAFDHYGFRKPYEKSIRYAEEFGLRDLSNYMLYNFEDTPEDLYQRMHLNIQLNIELGIRIFSFPMRYQPTNMKDRSHIGAHWNRYHLRSMQVILQATHGIVSGAPKFFSHAFGNSADEFIALLSRPEKFIFNRVWYEELGGVRELEQFKSEFSRLTSSERATLLQLLSEERPSGFANLRSLTTDAKLRSILQYYIPLADADERAIWNAMKEHNRQAKTAAVQLPPEEERVEDAGLLACV
jgi:hypothetical protein